MALARRRELFDGKWVGRQFAEDTWSWEIRPIIGKKAGRWYVSFNPAIEKSLHGPNSGRGFEFAPALNVKYDETPRIAAGIEYYGGLGPIAHFDPRAGQMQQISRRSISTCRPTGNSTPALDSV